MNDLFPLSPEEFMLGIVLCGMMMFFCVFVPVQLAAKIRRMRRARTHIDCRICGYRYLHDGPREENICPHCQARN